MQIVPARGERHAGGPGARVTSIGFEAIGEALASGRDPAPALAAAGASLGELGVPLGEALADLRRTSEGVCGRAPTYVETTAFAVAWGESLCTLLGAVSCEDPLTGLASRAHLRTTLAERYRRPPAHRRPPDQWAIVVIESLHSLQTAPPPGLGRALWLGGVASRVQTVFGGDPVGRVGADRVAVVAGRDADLGRRVALLRSLLDDLRDDGLPARVWIEGLPIAESGVDMLFDELSRT